MSKRGASSDLNHDNWEREDDPEEAGSFTQASDDIIKKRVIKVAKRRNPISTSQGDSEGKNAFGTFTGFGKSAPVSSNAFGFLSNLSKPAEEPKSNGTSNESDKNSKLDEYYSKLKGLNESVSEWIKKHVSDNPLVNLQPIFKDYEKYFSDLEKLKLETKSTDPKPTFSFISNIQQIENKDQNAPSMPMKLGSFLSGAPSATSPPKFEFGATKTDAPATFSFGTTSTLPATALSRAPTLSFGDGSSKGFSFTAQPFGSSSVAKSQESKDNEETNEEEDEPPKVEFKPVVEEGNVYTIRCKVFVKKDGNFGDRGVGNLFLKPVPNSEKMQLIVRADTNLGNLLCNFILSEGIPMQRMGKKDVMLVCLPTPDAKPPPVPILLRVKTEENADELLKTLEKYKK